MLGPASPKTKPVWLSLSHPQSPPSFVKGKWWWSWSYTALFLEALLLFWGTEGVVAMVIHNLLFSNHSPFSLCMTMSPCLYDHDYHPPFPRREGRRLCMTMTTIPSISKKRRRAFERKAVYDHDYQPFPSQKRRGACQRTPPHSLLGKCEATTPKRRWMTMPILVDEAPSDAWVVVGSLAVFVHLHEVGMGLLVAFRPIDPSLAILAIDRQALHFDEAAPNQSWLSKSKDQACVAFAFASSISSTFCERKVVVVMVIHSLILRSSHSPLGEGRGRGHVHTQPSF